jgi:hypothetical protein
MHELEPPTLRRAERDGRHQDEKRYGARRPVSHFDLIILEKGGLDRSASLALRIPP